MTLSLNYNDDLSRVQISITDLPFDSGTVRVERSTNELYWQTVRGAAALPVSGGAAAVDDFEFTPDVENFYRVVPIDPVAGLHLSGNTGSYASTPDHASLRVTGDIQMEAEMVPTSWAVDQSVLARYEASEEQRSYALWVSSAGLLRVVWSTDGTNGGRSIINSTTVQDQPDVQWVSGGLDVDDGSGQHVVAFKTDTGSGLIEFDSETLAGTTSIHAGTAQLEVGSHSGGAFDMFEGVISSVTVRDSGTAVADPDFSAQPMGTTSFTDSTGNLWTVNGDAYIAGTESSSITPSLDGRAWLKSIRHPFLNRPIHRALAGGGQSIGRASRGSVFEVQGRSVPVAVTDIRSSREFTLTIQVPDEAAARDMDLTLASEDIFFIQVPPELAPHMTGGYVRIGESTQHREADTIMWRFTIPCTVVAPPGPGVVGTTMTWGGVFRLYGSWEALVNSNPSWSELLATVGSPDDLVVL